MRQVFSGKFDWCCSFAEADCIGDAEITKSAPFSVHIFALHIYPLLRISRKIEVRCAKI